jgi:hypothetical protein
MTTLEVADGRGRRLAVSHGAAERLTIGLGGYDAAWRWEG